ncbi:MAG: PhzF family phenazine biosynthesis isomerase, partial [Actinomycetota bacterium]|nr:PhzF family phenazine biosynthesis isomerase [Actinomycetota bacterium]
LFARLSPPHAPVFAPAPSAEALAAVLSVETSAIGSVDLSPAAVSCGMPFVLVPLRDLDTLARVRVDLPHWESELAGSWTPDLYLFTPVDDDSSDFRARMFAPGMGVVEDPATGAAACALAAYLAPRSPRASDRWTVAQGIEMGRPSILYLEAEKRDGHIAAIRVGGTSVVVARGDIEA